MNDQGKIPVFEEFDDYYIATKGLIRAKHKDFHVFKLNEVGNKVVKKMTSFKLNYYHIVLASNLNTNLNIFGKHYISEDFTLVIFKPGQVVEWERTSDWEGYVLDVKEHFLDLLNFSQSVKSSSHLLENQPLVIKIPENDYKSFSYLFEFLYAEHKNLKEENVFVIKNLVQVLLVYIQRVINKTSDHVSTEESPTNITQLSYFENASKFRSLVIKEFMLSKSVAYYAEKLNISTAMLNTCVKKTWNKTPKDVINEVLLLYSQTMLKKTEVAIKEIAYQLNFDDYSHFVKFFKAQVGSSPAEYRQNRAI